MHQAARIDSSGRAALHRPARSNQGRVLPATLHRRRREPGEVVTRSASIQNHCRECLGWDSGGAGTLAEAVRDCCSPGCWLWPWRNGPLDPAAQQLADLGKGE